MRRLIITVFIAVACTSTSVQEAGHPAEAATADKLALYLTDSFNGGGLIAVHPLTLADRSATPLLPITPTLANNTWTTASLDGSAIAVMTYNYGEPPAAARGLDIAVYDARSGTLRSRYNPEVPIIVDGLSPDGRRIYARNWPPADFTAERLVLDATNGRILEREPRFSVAGDAIARTRDEQARLLYGLLVPKDSGATGPQPVDMASWDLRTGRELWRVSLPSLAAGEWKTGRIVDGAEVRSRLVPAVALSPDRTQIAVVRAFGCCVPHGTIWLIDAKTGTLISQRTHEPGASFFDQLFAPSIAAAKSLDESVIVHASFSTDGQSLHFYAHSSTINDQGEPRHQYYGMVTAALRDAAVRGHDIKMENYWYENRIEWIRASPDGRWLYVFLERTGSANPKGFFLRRVDASTLRVQAERQFDGYHQPFLLATR